MGARGPKPKPDILKALAGNPGKRPLNLDDGVNPDIAIPSAPSWISKEGAKEWRRMGAELLKLGLIAEIDKVSLAIYCQTWGDLCELEIAFAEIKKKASAEFADVDLAVNESFFQTTPTGFLRESMLHNKILGLRNDLDKYCKAFGLNPSARSRVTTNKSARVPDTHNDKAAPTPGGFGRFAPQLVK